MKRADLIVSALLALLSAYMMYKSVELPIGWIKEAGPGGGAFPFWLSVGMLVCSVLIFVRTFAGLSPEGRSEVPFTAGDSLSHFLVVTVALGVMIGLIHIIGLYFSVPLFLVFYLRVLGRHSWPVVAVVVVSVPVGTFLLFEKLLVIQLPKGFTEPLFDIFF